MKCEELLAALNEYVDGERRSVLCQALQEHLADCNPCQVVIDNIRQTIALYRAGQLVPLPAELHEQLRGILRERWAAKFPPAGDVG
jgi:predicted anti-sigma-YlaC factor YlaD